MYLTDDILVIPTCHYWINPNSKHWNLLAKPTKKPSIQNIIIHNKCVFLTQRKDRFELRVHNPQSPPYSWKNPHLLFVVSDILLKFSTKTYIQYLPSYERMELKVSKHVAIVIHIRSHTQLCRYVYMYMYICR